MADDKQVCGAAEAEGRVDDGALAEVSGGADIPMGTVFCRACGWSMQENSMTLQIWHEHGYKVTCEGCGAELEV